MASVPSEPRPVLGRLDAAGRLIGADSQLEELQRQAGSQLGQLLALPQVAEIAELARALGTAVGRPAVAASSDHDIDLWVNATPEGDEIALSLERWTACPPRGPRLAAILGSPGDTAAENAPKEWAADRELRLTSISLPLAQLLGVDAAEAAGMPLTRLFRLEEDDAGDMPLINAVAGRRGFGGQRARGRAKEDCALLLSGDAVTLADGSFGGFRGTAEVEGGPHEAESSRPALDRSLDELLRSPIDRIIDTAEHIVSRADGPLREEYASYGNDIASAARHLMSVLKGMSDDPVHEHATVDLAALSAEAVVMLDSTAEERGVELDLVAREPLPALGEERAIIQIVVNLISNAIRYSPAGSKICLTFSHTRNAASVTVADDGPGIAAGDEERIFERFERAEGASAGTGLGLAISRRLARSMGGDVTLDSNAGEGARFTLTLPA